MTDIVERLRATALDKDNFPCMDSERRCSVGLAKEAADEIERLRTVLQSLTKDPPPTLDEPDTDADVIIKMRAALQEIDRLSHRDTASAIARAALAAHGVNNV